MITAAEWKHTPTHRELSCSFLPVICPKNLPIKAMIKTEMSPYIYTAVFILKHFINYLSKDHFAILVLLYLSSVCPNQERDRLYSF